MRDPNLIEPRTANDLRVKPPHGRQTRVALGLEANGDDDNNANTYSRPLSSSQNADYRQSQSRHFYGDREGEDYAETSQSVMTISEERRAAESSQTSISGRPQRLQRARSDFGPRHRGERNAAVVEEDLWRMRHGWEDEYTSNEYLALLNSVSSADP